MRILIVGLNFAPEPTGVGKYTGDMAEWLARRGHDVAVISAPPYYPFWRIGDGYSSWRWRREEITGVHVNRCPLYVPTHPTGLRRMLHLASFGVTALPAAILTARRFKPDLVAAIVPTLCSAPAALAATRIAGAKSWVHIQDLEIDAAFELGILNRGRLRRAALASERALLSRFDLVSAISTAMLARLADKGVPSEKLASFPNWADVEKITHLPINRALRSQFGIADDRVVALYSGSMGEKHGLNVILEAARLLVGSRLHFVIAGDGPGRAMLADAAANLPNVTLAPLQPAERLNEFLAMADLHVLPQRPDAAELVMPSKLGAMLASGRPIVAMVAADSPVGQSLGSSGCIVPPGDAAAAARTLQKLADDPEERDRMGRLAREAAMALAEDQVLSAMETRLEGLVKSRDAARSETASSRYV